MHSLTYKRYSVLVASTFAFTMCFMVWMMLAVVGVPVKGQLGLNETQFGLMVAMPVLSGSLIRVPLGIWTDRYGGRIIMFVLMLCCVPAIYCMTFASAYWHFLVIGLLMGCAGGTFSVGTPYVARWFPPEQRGLAMGIFGAGNSGTAITKFLAPALIALGSGATAWHLVPKVYAAIMLGTAIIFWFNSYSDPSHIVSSKVTLRHQLALLKDPGVLRYCQYYSVVFGGYVGISLWMTRYYVAEYGLSLQTAALLAACFSLPGGVLRAFGGYMSDKFGAYKVTCTVLWICCICFFIISYPQTDLIVKTTSGPVGFHIGLNIWLFTTILFIVGVALAFGKASVFRYVADDYPEDIGVVSGMVGLAGGLGGFLLPIMFGALADLTGLHSSSFMLCFGTVCISLIWMALTKKKDILRKQNKEISNG